MADPETRSGRRRVNALGHALGVTTTTSSWKGASKSEGVRDTVYHRNLCVAWNNIIHTKTILINDMLLVEPSLRILKGGTYSTAAI